MARYPVIPFLIYDFYSYCHWNIVEVFQFWKLFKFKNRFWNWNFLIRNHVFSECSLIHNRLMFCDYINLVRNKKYFFCEARWRNKLTKSSTLITRLSQSNISLIGSLDPLYLLISLKTLLWRSFTRNIDYIRLYFLRSRKECAFRRWNFFLRSFKQMRESERYTARI